MVFGTRAQAPAPGPSASSRSASQGPTGPTPLFVAGLWRSRDSVTSAGAPQAPMVIHGTTLANSRYLGLATNPFSRGDAEREWPLIGQAALWSNLTDEA
jgi:hypothetical protein